MFALIVLNHNYNLKKKELSEERVKNNTLQRNIESLYNYDTSIKDIKKMSTGIDRRIKSAKTNEDVNNLLGEFIVINNNRVSNALP